MILCRKVKLFSRALISIKNVLIYKKNNYNALNFLQNYSIFLIFPKTSEIFQRNKLLLDDIRYKTIMDDKNYNENDKLLLHTKYLYSL